MVVYGKNGDRQRGTFERQTIYPQPGLFAGEVVGRGLDGTGREVVRISTERPWHVESVEGVSQFDVLPELLVEW